MRGAVEQWRANGEVATCRLCPHDENSSLFDKNLMRSQTDDDLDKPAPLLIFAWYRNSSSVAKSVVYLKISIDDGLHFLEHWPIGQLYFSTDWIGFLVILTF